MTEKINNAISNALLLEAIKVANKETIKRIEEKVEAYDVRVFDKLA